MRRRSARRALWLLGSFVAAATACVALLGWRLSRGPLRIPFLSSALERSLSDAEAALAVRIGSSEIAWGDADHALELRARDVEVAVDNERAAWIPTVRVEVSPGALLRGRVQPTAVELHGLQLALARERTGQLGIAAAGGRSMRAPTAGRRGGLLGRLQRIELVDGQLVFADHARGDVWHVGAVSLALQSSGGEGIALELAGAVELGTAVVPVRLQGVYGSDSARGVLSLRGAEPAALAARVAPPALAALLARLQLPLDCVLTGELDGSLRPVHLRLTADGGRGRIEASELAARAIDVQRLTLHASMDLRAETVAVEELLLDVEGASVTLEGRGDLASRRFDVRATLSKATAADVVRYWPVQTLPEVRRWIESSVSAGLVRDGRLVASGRLEDTGGLDIDAVEGAGRFDGVGVRLTEGTAPASGLAGMVRFGRGAWDVDVARGTIGGLDIVRAAVTPSAKVGPRRIEVRGTISGPLRHALRLVEAQRPGFARGLAFALDDVAGSVSADFETSLVPRHAASPSTDGLGLSAKLRDVAIPNAFRGAPLRSGDFTVELRRMALEVQGHAAFAGAPVSLAWRESLADPNAVRRIDVSGRLDTAAGAALGFDLRPWMDGAAALRASAQLVRGAGTIDLAADLAESSLGVPVLLLSKPAGAPGRVEARLTVAGTAVTRIERVLLQTAGIELRGRATLSPDGAGVQALDLEASVGPVPPAPRPARVTLAVRPTATGRDFVLTSDDAGTLFHAIGPEAYATGGRLRFAGTLPHDGSQLPFDGHLDVRDITITRAPPLARAVTLASLRGVQKSLSGGGIVFRSVTAGVRHRDPTIGITDGVAHGDELVLLLQGTIDRAADTVALRGTLVPSYYGRNAMGARIPVLGGLLTGSGREGLQAFDFTMSGPLASPRVAVAPMSSLAPGALRDVLRRLPGGNRR
jgi:uncharacterized protein YhdP